jgi:hypothetical protein
VALGYQELLSFAFSLLPKVTPFLSLDHNCRVPDSPSADQECRLEFLWRFR